MSCLGVMLFACGDTTSVASEDGVQYTDEMPDDLPAGECRDVDCDEGESSGDVDAAPAASEQGECQGSDACDGAGACVATFEDGQRGSFACRFACVPSLDEASWCRDDDSCCDPDASCTDRGYCVVGPTPERTSGAGKTADGDPEFSDQMPDDLPAGDGVPDDIAGQD